MDLITSAIIAALTAGLAAGLADTTKQIISDLYNSIKKRIEQRYGTDSKVIKAITDLEAEPTFAPYKTGLQQRITELKIESDPELISLAQELLSAISSSKNKENMRTVQNIYGDGNAVAGSGGTATVNFQQSKPKRRKK